MNKTQLIDQIHSEMNQRPELSDKERMSTPVSRDLAEKVLNALLETVTGALARGTKVSLAGFGTFEAVGRKARIGRNPKTGESLQIPAKMGVKFKPGVGLKGALNE